jgi:multidrug efflux pump subunit AcrA (membrane-fusion protein)
MGTSSRNNPVRSIRRTILLLVALPLTRSVPASEEPPILLTGEVFSRQAQEIVVPLTTSWRAQISRLAPEGSFVEPGDPVVAFDGTEAARAIEQHRETVRTEQARTERDLARLDKELVQAQFQLRQAELALELATLQAEIPEQLIGAIEHSENQLSREEAVKSLDDAHKQLEDRRKSLVERRRQAELDGNKNELQAAWWSEMLESFSVAARQPGYVIYGNHPWSGAKIQEGDTVRTSFRVAQVADTRDLAIRVWINAIDRPRVAAGEGVTIVLDALPETEFSGTIETISDSGSKLQEWGGAVYFEGVVRFDATRPEGLLPGMSALVEVGS